MNRLHPYSVFLLALLTGSAFLIAALLARPTAFSGGQRPQEKTSTEEEILVARAVDCSVGWQTALRGHGVAGWRTPEARPGGRAGTPLSLLACDRRAVGKSRFLKIWAGLPEERKGAAGLPYHTRSALKFKRYVDRYAARFRIKPNLVFAIIKAESNFDTMAVSTASAYGLMQLVPETGGRAAYKMVYGKDVIPTREYLEDPDNNIELGTAYLGHLAREYFDGVEDADSREYCLIAAYNTGPANVYRAFGGSYAEAMAKINSLSPSEVYNYLTRHLPYAETRKYLAKVVSSRSEFATL